MLKNGIEVSDPRLARIPQFDERSRNYPISAVVEGKRRRSYTWRCNTTLDQGREGSCVGHGIAHELIARPSEVPDIDHAFAMNLYYEAQKIDPWVGGAYPGANPFYEGTSVLAGVKIAHSMGYFDSYRWAFSFEDLVQGVGYNGPAVMGTNWYTGMINPDADGFVHVTGRIEGGHCWLLRSVNITKEYFIGRNSWGGSWGRNGDFYITFADMERLQREYGEAAFFIGRHRNV